MASEGKVFVNVGKGPLIVKNSEGKAVRILVGETVTLDEKGVERAYKMADLKDFSKIVKPAAGTEELRKENAELKAKLAAGSGALVKEIAALKAELAKAKKDLEELVS